MKTVEREIEVVENIIRILNECLSISLKNKRKEEAKSTIKDIHLCKKELQRLKEQREALVKEPAGDAAI
jgi:hypothetical protein